MKKMGIETLGIGIMDRSVSRFYPQHVVINKIDDLPGLVMGEIKKILT
jgi:cobaltochelatase CobT